MKILGFGILLCLLSVEVHPQEYNDYSSFISANATLAVVVDQEYMREHNINIMAHFQKILGDTIRENLKNGGINVKYFTWSGIRLRREYLAAMTVMNCDNTMKFYEATRSTSVLLIAITDPDCTRLPAKKALMIPFVHRGEAFPQMILDAKVQNVLRWKSAVLIMDKTIINENSKLVESVIQESTKNDILAISLYLYGIDDRLRTQKKRHAIREVLTPFRTNPREYHQFIVFSEFYEDIIEMAESMQMFHVNNQWLFFVLDKDFKEFDAMALTQNLGEGANIAFALNETKAECDNSLNCTIEELSFSFVQSISKLIAEEQAIYGEISDEEWEALRYTKKEKQDDILNTMREYLKSHSKCSSCSRWRFDTSITWGKSQEHNKFIKDSFDNRNKHFEFVNFGYWTPVLGFITHELAFPNIAHFFRNVTLDILTTHNPPWQILEKDNKGTIVKHTGIVMEIVKEISRMLNFTYKLHDVGGAEYNDEQAKQNDTALLGTLTYSIPYQVIKSIQSNKFFIAAVAATVDEPDNKPFNYTIPISIQSYSFISRKPDEVSRIYLFTAPFTLETWSSLVGVLLLTSPVLYVINRFVPVPHLHVKGFSTVKDCFWYIYGALLQQGGMYLPQADSGRLVIGFWWIVVIVIVTTYCGNLVAFLTFPKFQPSLNFFYQLYQHSEYEHIGLRNGTLFEKYAASFSSRPELNRFLETAIIYNNLEEENIEAVKRGKRVNIDWRINLQETIQKHFEKDKECRFALGKENFLDEQIALILPSNSPYLNLINDQINRLNQMGFIERWHEINLPPMDKCDGRGVMRQITNHKVNLDDMQGCFLVLLLGFLFALFIIVMEYLCYHWKKTHENRSRSLFTY